MITPSRFKEQALDAKAIAEPKKILRRNID
jgi:hypothetical protein